MSLDPVSIAIISGIASGAAEEVTKSAGNVISHAYRHLQSLIEKKFGAHNEVSQAIKGLEAHPDSEGRKQVLYEEVKKLKLDSDEEIDVAARQLLEALGNRPGVVQAIQQTAVGTDITQVAGSQISIAKK